MFTATGARASLRITAHHSVPSIRHLVTALRTGRRERYCDPTSADVTEKGVDRIASHPAPGKGGMIAVLPSVLPCPARVGGPVPSDSSVPGSGAVPTEEEARRQEIARTLRQLLTDLEVLAVLLRELLDAQEAAQLAPPGRSVPQPGASTGSPGRDEDRREEIKDSFTERERQVFRLLLTGMSNRQIGRDLGIAERTVKNNLHAIYRKLGVSSRTEAVAEFLGACEPPGPGSGRPPGRRRPLRQGQPHPGGPDRRPRGPHPG
ncbi:LuxR C-terminal-related transcriptional regulator [Streptomyces sp. NPDC059631]|uniref:LuxR C-terminal-related transcriptional regulator n=2 Tax=Streptomyces TaxID=1883 RepID=UPI0036945EB3